MIRILLVDDQKVIREGLKILLESEKDLQIIGMADNGFTAIEQVEKLKPDLVLIDMEMPGLDGANATKAITKKFANTKVLMLSSYDRDEYVTKSLSVGANGYLLKNTTSQEIAEAIRCVYKGYSQIGPGLLEKLLAQTNSSITVSNFNNSSSLNKNTSLSSSFSTEKPIASITKSTSKEASLLSTNSPTPKQPSIWKRLLFGTTFISLGIAGMTLGSIVLSHRLSNLVLENGVINGRVLRLRSPIDGKLEQFYPRPGVVVRPNQILARIQSSAEQPEAIPQLEAEVQSKSKQLLSAQQLLTFLQSSLQQQESQSDRVWQVEVKIEDRQVSQQQAIVDKALAQAKLARLDYERFRKLQEQGAIAQQKVDQAKATWDIAEAEVKEARESLRSTQIARNASQQKLATKENLNWGNNLAKETAQLKQQIVNQSLLIDNLRTELELVQQQLEQLRSRANELKQVEIKAPLSAVVYSTEREQGELIRQSEALLTLLDCNDIWVETVVDAKDATKIDMQQPVMVELAGETEPIEGKIALIQAVSSQGEQERSQRLQSQALVPTIPKDLVGQNLSRITVAIPPPSNYSQTNKFCGLGQPSRLTFATHTEVKPPKLIANQWQRFQKLFAFK
jgi:DNA-binding NarL/FixJ family response regulator/multidrug efflux pump subunit AcrA (membrane-fusion protein)